MILFGWHVWRGESGRRYRFKITLTRRGIPAESGGIYVFVRRWFLFFLQPLYVGKATNLRDRLLGHEKWPRAFWKFRATERHILRVADERDRAAIEEDLVRRLKPPMNDMLIPRDGDDKANTRPPSRFWWLENWLKLKAREAR